LPMNTARMMRTMGAVDEGSRWYEATRRARVDCTNSGYKSGPLGYIDDVFDFGR